jgi:hypothetical protein
MNKTYPRKSIVGILYILLSLTLPLDLIWKDNFTTMYDGIKIIVAIVLIVYGIGYIITPIITIDNSILKIRKDPFTRKSVDLKRVKEIGFNKSKGILLFDGYKLKLTQLQTNKRDELVSDLKHIRQTLENS